MNRRSLIIASCLILTGASLYFGPGTITDRLRGAGLDLLRPGLELVCFSKESVRANYTQSMSAEVDENQRIIAKLTESLANEKERSRTLKIYLAHLTERTRTDQAVPSSISSHPRLILPSLIDAAILGDTIANDWCSGKLLDQGAKSGIREKELVLASRKSKRLLIDIGDEESISPEDALLLGQCVIGKIEHVGHWTSTIQLITDAKFSGRAQLIRETPEGFVFDATEGIILKGTGGPLCQLVGIPAENSVHIHDFVLTRERDGLLPTPLYYGEVVKATLEPDEREWTVYVQPAPLPNQLTRVQVLRMVLNPERLVSK